MFIFAAPYIGKGCHPDDPKINECIVRKGAPAVEKIVKGKLKESFKMIIKRARLQNINLCCKV